MARYPVTRLVDLRDVSPPFEDGETLVWDAGLGAFVAGESGGGEAPPHVHPQEDVVGLEGALAACEQIARRGVPGGYAGLNGAGQIELAALPAIAVVDITPVASQAAQLALDAEKGDVAVRTDESKTYMHNGGSAGTMADWTLLATPGDLVLSVAGKSGAVTLVVGDVTGLQAALDGKAATAHTHGPADLTFDAATQAELDAEAGARAAADAALAAAVDSKQDAATAATQAELDAGLATKQDAATAATDADLAAHAAAAPAHGGQTIVQADAKYARPFPGLIAPTHIGAWANPNANQAMTANRLFLVRSMPAPHAGFLRDLLTWIGTAAGNLIFVVYDVGEATPGSITKLWESAPSAAAGTQYNVRDPGDGTLPVAAGQRFHFGLICSAASAFGRAIGAQAGMAVIPPGYDPLPIGGALTKLYPALDVGSFSAPATITEANLLGQSGSPGLFYGRVA